MKIIECGNILMHDPEMSGAAECGEDVRDLVEAEKIRERIGLLDCTDECPDFKEASGSSARGSCRTPCRQRSSLPMIVRCSIINWIISYEHSKGVVHMSSFFKFFRTGSNPPVEEIRTILNDYKNVAVVGLSNDPGKASYRVAEYLKDHGYRIIPVNPTVDEVLGEKSYPDLKSVPLPVEIVDIFRKPEAIPAIVDEAIDIGAKVIWMQLGLYDEKSARKARQAGLQVVQSRCMEQENMKMRGE